MYIKKVSLYRFRCFDEIDINFSDITLIAGPNGSGKSSILESLYYGCYARSFRAVSPMDLIQFNQEAFSVNIEGNTEEESWRMTVGFSSDKEKYVKKNDKKIETQRDVLQWYRVLSITENDLDIIAGYPQGRRHFLDSILSSLSIRYTQILRSYEQVLKQRSAVLAQDFFDKDMYEVWTTKFNELYQTIEFQRRHLLKELTIKVSDLYKEYIGSSQSIQFNYKKQEVTSSLLEKERFVKRTLYGAHLDDIEILFNNVPARFFSSRGQQKMLLMLLKLAVLQIINKPHVILLDDYMTDFDINTATKLLTTLISHKNQIIITCPCEENSIIKSISNHNINRIHLS